MTCKRWAVLKKFFSCVTLQEQRDAPQSSPRLQQWALSPAEKFGDKSGNNQNGIFWFSALFPSLLVLCVHRKFPYLLFYIHAKPRDAYELGTNKNYCWNLNKWARNESEFLVWGHSTAHCPFCLAHFLHSAFQNSSFLFGFADTFQKKNLKSFQIEVQKELMRMFGCTKSEILLHFTFIINYWGFWTSCKPRNADTLHSDEL